ISCVILKAPMTNNVISFPTPSIKMEGKNISAKPTKTVSEACVASGTCNNSKYGTKGFAIIAKIGVYVAIIVANVPTLMTTRKITNHISITVLKPDLKNALNPGALIPVSVAISNPWLNAVLLSGNFSVLISSDTSFEYSSLIDLSGQILGKINAQTIHEIITDK